MRLGEVWLVDLPYSGGREQAGRRPAVVVQSDVVGSGSPLVTVVPFSSRLASARYSSTVVVAPESGNGLGLRSVAMVFQVRSLDPIRFVSPLGQLAKNDLDAIRAEIRSHFGV